VFYCVFLLEKKIKVQIRCFKIFKRKNDENENVFSVNLMRELCEWMFETEEVMD